MDEQQTLILIRDKDDITKIANQTRNIVGIIEEEEKYKITFKNGKTYPYNKERVGYFNQPKPISIENAIVNIKDEEAQRWDSAVIFEPYICLFRGDESYYTLVEQVELIQNIAGNVSTQYLLAYYRHLASYIKDSSKHLDYYYTEKLTEIRSDSVLKNFIDRTPPCKYLLEENVIFPFGINSSQQQAVINALTNQISLIQGPPGTGKTQTILNIIANLLMRDKTIAIVAGNNSATANVYEKLQKEDIGFLAATLGNKELQMQFFESVQAIPDISSWLLPFSEQRHLILCLNQLSQQLNILLDSKSQLAHTKEQLNRLMLEQAIFQRHFPMEPVNPAKWSLSTRWATPNLLEFLAEIKYYSKHKNLTWPTKLRWLYKYKIYKFKDLKNFDNQIIKGIIIEYYRRRVDELNKDKEELETLLNKENYETIMEQQTTLSLRLFRNKLAEHFRSIDSKELEFKNYKKKFKEFLQRYPVVLSTTDSIINNKSEFEVFDYLIVDEASQVDLLAGFLSMACAKNIIAVGDLKQLPHIPSEEIIDLKYSIDDKFNILPGSGYSYVKDSLLSSLETVFSSVAPVTLLKEHYRCHPGIIGFCNQKFYDGKLIIMTDSDSDPFKIFKTVPGNHHRRPQSGKGLFNEREIDVIINEVLDEELKFTSNFNIGITAPYRAQVEKAQQLIKSDGLQIDTVYKYQGREKETIVFSTTSGRLNRFVDDPNLLNVAVSRAKKRFIIVTAPQSFKQQGSNIGDLIRYIEYQSLSPSIFESKTVSIFDFLYKEYSDALNEFLSKRKNSSAYSSENLMAALLDEVLQDIRYNAFSYHQNYAVNLLINNEQQFTPREHDYASHPNTHVDFLIYNKLDKFPVLAIEVDGYQFHEMNSYQKERDSLKDSILAKLNLPLIRFRTTGSGERDKLKKAMDSILVNVDELTEE